MSGDTKKKLLVISEPLNSLNSVQLRVVLGFVKSITSTFEVTVATVNGSAAVEELFKNAGIRLIYPQGEIYKVNKILTKIGKGNEASVWAEAWLMEALIEENSKVIRALMKNEKFDFVINTSNTVAIESDIWWIQGISPESVLQKMEFRHAWQKGIARMIGICLRTPNPSILRRFVKNSRVLVANSNYVRNYYSDMGVSVKHVAYTLPDMSGFKPLPTGLNEKYVLSYIGKETEVGALEGLIAEDIKVIAFGGKMVPGIFNQKRPNSIHFRGRVTHEQLVELYSNALFTVFPFTDEPLGWIPVESMACGTPVLTYNKQGPMETVVNGETGWLVDKVENLISTGSKLWHEGFERETFSRNSIERAALFSPEHQAKKIIEILT